MSFIKLYSANPADSGALKLTISSQAYTKDTLAMPDRSNKVVIPATSSSATTTTLFLIRETVANTATEVDGELVNPFDLYLADCTSNTASTQLYIRHALTDSATVNNTTSDVATDDGIFEAFAVYGAASDKKLIGRLVYLGQDCDVS